jgi:addiction module RelE/StbE family toxin
MNTKVSPGILEKLKKLDVRIRNSFKEKILIFSKNPEDPILDNHSLKREWQGCRSIDITADYRAIYREIPAGNETIAYFVALGTHKQLYGKSGK